jgi:hypothetical protein
MKIVQSLWSAPAQKSGGWQNHSGGWPQARFFWHSWALSTGLAFKHYGNVELITDAEGARWLVDKLKLPFTSVRADVLENLDAPPYLWAFGKVVAYRVQKEPFYHIDGDVFLGKKLPERYEQAEIVCQCFEQAPAFLGFSQAYDESRFIIERRLPWLPRFWNFMSERSAVNCGIFGGRNLAAIARYVADVIQLVTCPQNRPIWSDMALNRFVNCVVEQQTLWCSAREQGVKLTPLFENTDFSDLISLERKARAIQFNHAAGLHTEELGKHISRQAQQHFPHHYRIIEELFPAPKKSPPKRAGKPRLWP